jgi:hypothetical protein
MNKLLRNTADDEAKKYWELAQERYEARRSWPAWRRAGVEGRSVVDPSPDADLEASGAPLNVGRQPD